MESKEGLLEPPSNEVTKQSRRFLNRGGPIPRFITAAVMTAALASGAPKTLEHFRYNWEPPTKAETVAVEMLFDRPGNQADMSDVMLDPPEPATTMTRAELAKKKYGLTVHDYISEIQDLRGPRKDINGDVYYERTKNFLAKYGVDLVLGTEEDITKEGERQLLPEELDTVEVKTKMLGLIQSVGLLPVEAVKVWGVKKVVLLRIPPEHKHAGYVRVGVDPDTYYADPAVISFKDFTHEAYHGNDARELGPKGMYNDEAFNALNPTDTDIYKERGQYISREAYDNFALKISDDLRLAKEKSDSATVTALQKQLDDMAVKVVVNTEYSFKDMAEDKAEIGKEIFNIENYPKMLDPKKPFLRRKFLALLARIYKEDPRIVQFFADISSRPQTRPEDIPKFTLK